MAALPLFTFERIDRITDWKMEEIEKIALVFAHDHLILHAVIVALCMAAMLVAMTADLVTGIQKAKQRGEATTSKGLKKTAAKAEKYFMPFMVTVCIDFISSVVVPVPVFSMLWAAYCCLCEWKSVRESVWKKEEIAQQERTLRVLIENKDDIVRLMKELQEEGKSEK